MKLALAWTPRAQRDRQAAIDYIARDNPIAALGQLDEIERQTDMLLQHPRMGRPGRVDGTFELVISHTPFIAVYRLNLQAQRIELMRLLHSAQCWPPSRDSGT